MVKVICHTNLDDYRFEVWPNEMYNPQVGHSVKATSGKKLKIVQITHCQRTIKNGNGTGFIEACLEIELHK